jgi:hypothetical protein
MATSGERPGTTGVGDADDLDATARVGHLSDDQLTVVRDDGVRIVVDDGIEVVHGPAPRPPWWRTSRSLWWAGLALVALVVAAVAWIAARDDEPATRVTTRPGAVTATTAAPTASTGATTPATTAAPVGDPGATAPQPTPAPTTPVATSPPATHDPADLTGLVRAVTPSAVTLAPGAQATVTVRATNTSSWTMRVGSDYCGMIVETPGACVQGSVLTEIAAGASHERTLTVTAPDAPGAYTFRVTAPLDGWQADIAVTVTG